MKTVKTQFVCDNCGNYEYVNETLNASAQAADRKKRGWTKIDKKDICPVCTDGKKGAEVPETTE